VQDASPKGYSNRNFSIGAGSAGALSAVLKPNCSQWMEKFLLHIQEKIDITIP